MILKYNMCNYVFSIIIPVHNNACTIEKCVKSLINQGIDLQIILIENNSSDNSLKICQSIRKHNSGIELFESNEIGVSAARNLGLKKATGKYIGFCDGDDFYLPGSLSCVLSKFTETNADIVVTGFDKVYSDHVEENIVKKEEIISTTKLIEYISCYPPIMGSVWNKFYKREKLSGNNFDTEIDYLEDGCFNYNLLTKDRDLICAITCTKTYAYLKHVGAATANISRQYKDDRLLYIEALVKALREYKFTNDEISYIKDQIFRLAVSRLWNESYPSQKAKSLLADYALDNFNCFIKHIFINDFPNRTKLFIKFLILKLTKKLN